MRINKLLLIPIAMLSSTVFASSALIERQKIIMESDPAYEFNLQLKQVSPMMYEVVHDIDRFNQLEEIKVLLQKIVDSHENLVTTSQY